MRWSLAIAAVTAGAAAFIGLGLLFPWVTLVSSVVVDRPLPAIWHLVADVDRLPQWLHGLRSVEILSGEAQRPGSRYRLRLDLAGSASTLDVTIALIDRQRRYVLETTTDWGRVLTDVRLAHTPRGVEITIRTAAAADRMLARSLLVLRRRGLNARQNVSLHHLRALIENEVPPYAEPPAAAAGRSRRSLVPPHPSTLRQLERPLNEQCQRCRRDRSLEDQPNVVQTNARENGLTVSACADQRTKRCRADIDDCRGLDAGNDGPGSERQLDQPQARQRRQPQGQRRLTHVRRHIEQPGMRIADDRQEAVEEQSRDGGPGADAEHRNHEDQQRQCRNGLDEAGTAEQGSAKSRPQHGQYTERYGGQDRRDERDRHEAQVLDCVLKDAQRPGLRLELDDMSESILEETCRDLALRATLDLGLCVESHHRRFVDRPLQLA